MINADTHESEPEMGQEFVKGFGSVTRKFIIK
jgi:hypothetical protein